MSTIIIAVALFALVGYIIIAHVKKKKGGCDGSCCK
ncbi:MAG: FeoB-associated Cys-rich membrane protein [Lactobacillales bacterium]|nr:FeoB-associated Cys-rich membrane protein [Lactobacillales bacterium]